MGNWCSLLHEAKSIDWQVNLIIFKTTIAPGDMFPSQERFHSHVQRIRLESKAGECYKEAKLKPS